MSYVIRIAFGSHNQGGEEFWPTHCHSDPEAASCGQDFVTHKMQPYDARTIRPISEMTGDGFFDHSSQLIPIIPFAKNGMAQSAGAKTAFLSFLHFKNDFAHTLRLIHGAEFPSMVLGVPAGTSFLPVELRDRVAHLVRIGQGHFTVHGQ
jgi:hypothetical protein